MTKEECAIVTLYTGVSMLEGDDLEYLYRYVEKLMERPVFTHELATLADELKKRAKPDFINLCRWASAQLNTSNTSNTLNALDCIIRQAAIDALEKVAELFPWKVPGNRDSYDRYNEAWNDAIGRAEIEIEKLPSAQPEPLSDAYMKAVWTWLLNYQIKAAELKGRYTPYEVLSWVANDWRKEHE